MFNEGNDLRVFNSKKMFKSPQNWSLRMRVYSMYDLMIADVTHNPRKSRIFNRLVKNANVNIYFQQLQAFL